MLDAVQQTRLQFYRWNGIPLLSRQVTTQFIGIYNNREPPRLFKLRSIHGDVEQTLALFDLAFEIGQLQLLVEQLSVVLVWITNRGRQYLALIRL